MLSLVFFVYLIADIKCPTSTKVANYHLIETCRRSTLGVVARAKFLSLISCKRLGLEKKALAFNFNPNWDPSELQYPCEALKCAEVEGGLSLSNDSRYDYYSMFANLIPNNNATCVPGVGMFNLRSQKLNYTNAENKCRNQSSLMANVNNEQRTDSLAQLLSGAGVAAAFVGFMRKENGTKFLDIDGNSIDCAGYKAWAPGHPRRSSAYNCVLLTKQHTWRTTPCINKQPFLCELIPNGPYIRGSIFNQNNINV